MDHYVKRYKDACKAKNAILMNPYVNYLYSIQFEFKTFNIKGILDAKDIPSTLVDVKVYYGL